MNNKILTISLAVLMLILLSVTVKQCNQLVDTHYITTKQDSIQQVRKDSILLTINELKDKLHIQDSLRRKYHLDWISLYNQHCKIIHKYESKLKNYRDVRNVPIDSVERYISSKLYNR